MRDQLREVDAAYIAGILDGEGYVTVVREKRKRIRLGDVVYDYIPAVSITQARVELLEHIARSLEYGYSINKGGRERKYFRLYLRSQTIQWLLPQVIPFLVLKKEQAELVLQLSKERTARSGQHQYDEATHRRAEAVYWKVRSLNSLDVYWAKQQGMLIQFPTAATEAV